MKRLLLPAFFALGLLVLPVSCGKKTDYRREAQNPALLHRTVKTLTDVIIHDIFSPPVASRVYVYSHIAAYEALIPDHANYRSLAGQLKGLENVPQPDKKLEYCFPLASLHAFLTVGRALTFSADKVEDYQTQLDAEFREAGVPDEVFERSKQYGEAVAKHILDWSGKDQYKQTRGFRYTVTNTPGEWVPTPPAYMDAIEPNWFKIRPFVLDSCNQFAPPQPCAFSPLKDSDFYREMMEVYDITRNITDEQKQIASFWDCNPFVMHNAGHVMYATKKMTPGGHWLSIAGIASRKTNADLMKSLEAYTMVSLSLADGFISCWDTKYRTKRVRPETVINQYVDKDWQPLLQTPPFPEYTSGHSVISTAASLALTRVFGDHFAYTDSTEVPYGIPPRSFQSFTQAAQEAAISRLYGGIHYRSAIDKGVDQGKQVGEWINSHVQTRKDQPVIALTNNR